jgi:hypothetical protein
VGDDVEIAGKALPKTFSVATPNGGRHLYFSAEGQPLRNTAGKLGRHIDTRGVGGYVVGPGSALTSGYYRIATQSPVAQLPGCIADTLMSNSPTVSGPSFGELRENDVRAILEREMRRVRTAPVGSRNGALNTAAFLIGKLVGSGRITEVVAWNVLETAAHGHLRVQGFARREVNQTIRSGLTAGIRAWVSHASRICV